MTLCQLYAKQNAQRANVKKSTQKQREQLMRLLKEDYNTINNHKRSLKASFYIAIQDDCVRKNPFDFKLK
ncbi:site-specific integrase, partial [Dorea formicigenerans]